MFEHKLDSEYFFWVLLFLFYFLDNVKLVENQRLLFAEDIVGKFSPKYRFSTFEISSKQVHLLNIFLPSSGFLNLDSYPTKEPSAKFQETIDDLVSFQKGVRFFKIVSLFSFVYLLSGPILTMHVGLGATLAFLMPIHLATLALTLVLFLGNREKLGLTEGMLVHVFFECAVMPAYLPNIVRKIYSKKTFNCDGNFFSLQTSPSSDREFIEYSISRKINYLSEQADIVETRSYSDYKRVLGLKDEYL